MTQIIISVYNLCLRWHLQNFSCEELDILYSSQDNFSIYMYMLIIGVKNIKNNTEYIFKGVYYMSF